MDQWLAQLQEDLSSYQKETEDGIIGFKDLKNTEKVKVGVQTRLTLMSPYVKKWPQAMALGLKP